MNRELIRLSLHLDAQEVAGTDGLDARQNRVVEICVRDSPFLELEASDMTRSIPLRTAFRQSGASSRTSPGFGGSLVPGIGDHPARHSARSWLMVRSRSRHDLLDHLAVEVGQAVVAAGVAEGELLVVEAQQMQDRRVDVVDVHLVLDGLEAQFVGRAVDVAPFTPPPASHIVKP